MERVKNLLTLLPEVKGEEYMYIHSLTKDYSDDKIEQFAIMYGSRRKDPQTILIVTILGLICLAGIQRFLLGQIGMGLLYLFTGGLCLIGTIMDLVNYQKLTLEFNQKEALEINRMLSM